MAPRVVVLDYGSGNLRSAQRALERVGASVVVTSDLAAARSADGLVVPGVGAYAACMAGIDALAAGPVIEGALVATTVHGGAFAAAVECGALCATQFHPEKSGDAGAALLANWVGSL